MNGIIEKLKASLRNQKVYEKLRSNPILSSINSYYKNKETESKRQSVQQYGLESLNLAKEVFSDHGIDFWLDYGTLLGAIREKDFIGHDFDIDIATLFISNESAKEIEKDLINKGFKKYREFMMDGKLVEETYLYKGVNFDIFYYYQNVEGKVHCFAMEEGEKTIYDENPTFTKITGLAVKRLESTFTGITWIDFKGEKFPVPESYHQYLEDNYGPTYMIKNENWDWSEKEKGMLPFEDNTLAYIFKQK